MIELSPGEYDIELEASGFKKLKILRELITDRQRELEFQLEPPVMFPHGLIAPDQQLEIKASPLTNTIRPRKIQ